MPSSEKRELNIKRRTVIGGAAALTSQLVFPVSSFAVTRPTSTGREKMDIDRFVEDCITANLETEAQAAVNEVLAKAVSTPKAVLDAIGEPSKAGLNVFHKSSTLTVFAATWTPQMNLMPHDHLMWANIGIYTGREDNIFWSKTENSIEASGVAALFAKDTAMLPEDALHSVTNPLQRFTGGIHIYGGDFFGIDKHQWNPETLEEQHSDGAKIRSMFEDENRRLGLDT